MKAHLLMVMVGLAVSSRVGWSQTSSARGGTDATVARLVAIVGDKTQPLDSRSATCEALGKRHAAKEIAVPAMIRYLEELLDRSKPRVGDKTHLVLEEG